MKKTQKETSTILRQRYDQVAEARISELSARRTEVEARIKANTTRNRRQLAERSLHDTLADLRQGIVVTAFMIAILGTGYVGNALLNMGCEHVGVLTSQGRICL